MEPNENNDHAYQRGETIFDRCEDDLKNLTDILNQQEQINTFFEICKQKLMHILSFIQLASSFYLVYHRYLSNITI